MQLTPSFLSHLVSARSLKHLLRRFWPGIIMLAILTLLLLTGIEVRNLWNTRWYVVLVYYLSTAAMLDTSLRLWCEEEPHEGRRMLLCTVCHALWAANAAYLILLPDVGFGTFIGNGAAVLLIGLSVLTGSFLRTESDVPYWHFSLSVIAAAGIAWLTSWLLCGGLVLLITMLDTLFGLSLGSRGHIYEYFFVVCSTGLAPLLWLMQMPEGPQKFISTPRPVPVINVIARYILTPLLIAYMVVLYAYAIQILIRLELPNGWVSWPISVLVGGALLVSTLLYPARMESYRRYDEFSVRWLPLLILPLLVLMSVGAARRISDYGITVARLYLVTFNVWSYAILTYLFVTRSRRIRMIPISITLCFLLVSVGPWSYAAVVRRSLTAEVRQALAATPPAEKLPMSADGYKNWLKKLPQEEAERIDSKLNYLYNTYGQKSVEGMVDVGHIGYWTSYVERKEIQSTTYRWSMGSDKLLTLPKGYHRFVRVKNSDNRGTIVENRMPVSLTCTDGKEELTIHAYIPLYKMRQTDGGVAEDSPLILPCEEEGYLLLLTDFYYNSSETSRYRSLEGYVVAK